MCSNTACVYCREGQPGAPERLKCSSHGGVIFAWLAEELLDILSLSLWGEMNWWSLIWLVSISQRSLNQESGNVPSSWLSEVCGVFFVALGCKKTLMYNSQDWGIWPSTALL